MSEKAGKFQNNLNLTNSTQNGNLRENLQSLQASYVYKQNKIILGVTKDSSLMSDGKKAIDEGKGTELQIDGITVYKYKRLVVKTSVEDCNIEYFDNMVWEKDGFYYGVTLDFGSAINDEELSNAVEAVIIYKKKY